MRGTSFQRKRLNIFRKAKSLASIFSPIREHAGLVFQGRPKVGSHFKNGTRRSAVKVNSTKLATAMTLKQSESRAKSTSYLNRTRVPKTCVHYTVLCTLFAPAKHACHYFFGLGSFEGQLM